METPGRDDDKVLYPIDFQLKYIKSEKLFMGHYYVGSNDTEMRGHGSVYISRKSDADT